jgi:hypothetical protein
MSADAPTHPATPHIVEATTGSLTLAALGVGCAPRSRRARRAVTSVFTGQHDGQHAPGHDRVRRISGMAAKRRIVVVDLEQHPLAGDLDQPAVVLAMGSLATEKSSKRRTAAMMAAWIRPERAAMPRVTTTAPPHPVARSWSFRARMHPVLLVMASSCGLWEWMSSSAAAGATLGRLEARRYGSAPGRRPKSTIRLLHRRMGANQQMRWSPRGAHRMLKVRTAVANGTLAADHIAAERWAHRPFRPAA